MKPTNSVRLQSLRKVASTPVRVLNYWRSLEIARAKRQTEPVESDTIWHVSNYWRDQLELDDY